ncbi:MAG: hypothetical protein GXO77_03180 [Calditrichaeota bacterium]|nr:hypothetical protein [Calditrichota bacterium]
MELMNQTNGFEPYKSNHVQLLLIVSGMTTRSVRAVKLIKNFCEQNLSDFELIVFDVYQEPVSEDQQPLPVAPLLIGNIPWDFAESVKIFLKKEGIFIPVVQANLVQVNEMKGALDEGEHGTKISGT